MKQALTRLVPCAAALGVITLGLSAPAAFAAASITVTADSGTVGVQELVSAQVTNWDLLGQQGLVTFTVKGQVIGTDTVGGSQGNLAQVYYTPNSAGSTSISASLDSGGSGNTQIYVSKVATTADIVAPATAASGTTISLTSTVRARQGSYVPTGSVSFFDNSGSLGSSGLNNQGVATLNYRVPSGSSVTVYSSYGGDSGANSSGRSPSLTIKTGSTPSSSALVVPSVVYQNSPLTLTSTINPTSGSGSVEFFVDNRSVGRANVANGSASVTWVPTSLGNPTVRAVYSGGNGVAGSSDSRVVAVVPALKVDAITVQPDGQTGPMIANSTYVMANGTSVNARISSASGLPVKVTVTGPCAWNGTTFTVQGVGGTCSVVTSTAGGNGYAPTSSSFIVSTQTGNQSAVITAPKNGTYKRNATLTLGKVGAVTNVNQKITWKVTSGASICKLIATKGNYTIKLLKAGSCKATATAPAISGQWNAYTTARSYKVK